VTDPLAVKVDEKIIEIIGIKNRSTNIIQPETDVTGLKALGRLSDLLGIALADDPKIGIFKVGLYIQNVF